LRGRVASLNDRGLFDRAEEARAFREWYLSRPWAEEEGFPGQTELLRISAVE
jgi:hypothetical protein